MLLSIALEFGTHDHILNIHSKDIIASLVHFELSVAIRFSSTQCQCPIILAFSIPAITWQPAFIGNRLVGEELEHLSLSRFYHSFPCKMDMILSCHLLCSTSIPSPTESIPDAVKFQRFRNRNIIFDIDSQQSGLNREHYCRRFGFHQKREFEIRLLGHAKFGANSIKVFDRKRL